MIKFFIFNIFLFLISIGNAQGAVFQVYDLSKIQEESRNLDRNALVIFDIDYTLLAPKDLALRPCGKEFRKKYLQSLDLMNREFLQSILAIQSEEVLVDEATPCLIKQIQKRGIPVIALTALETGEYGIVKNLEDWRLDQLHKFGIDFSRAFPEVKPFKFEEIPLFQGRFAIFKEGVIFTNQQSKGEVLKAFLRRVNWIPKKILFVDDSLKQICTVEKAAETLGISFIGFHYRGIDQDAVLFSPKIAEFQFRQLLMTKRWLPAPEAKKILEECK